MAESPTPQGQGFEAPNPNHTFAYGGLKESHAAADRALDIAANLTGSNTIVLDQLTPNGQRSPNSLNVLEGQDTSQDRVVSTHFIANARNAVEVAVESNGVIPPKPNKPIGADIEGYTNSLRNKNK